MGGLFFAAESRNIRPLFARRSHGLQGCRRRIPSARPVAARPRPRASAPPAGRGRAQGPGQRHRQEGRAAALAGAAGVLLGLYYNQIEPLMGMTPGLKAFVAAVLGGIGIIPGAALGGFVIGIIETFTYVISLDTFRDAIVYAVLIIILLVRPSGILGKNVKEKV